MRNTQVAWSIADTSIRAGLAQQARAALVGTTQPVIARLEDADDEGHSLALRQRIVSACHQKRESHLVPVAEKAQ